MLGFGAEGPMQMAATALGEACLPRKTTGLDVLSNILHGSAMSGPVVKKSSELSGCFPIKKDIQAYSRLVVSSFLEWSSGIRDFMFVFVLSLLGGSIVQPALRIILFDNGIHLLVRFV